MEEGSTCHFCAYPMLDTQQVICTECGERADGDASSRCKREWELIWSRYRWVLILSVLAVPGIAAIVLHQFVTAHWLCMQLSGVFAVSIVLGMFIKHGRAQLLALLLIGGLMIQFLWGANMAFIFIAILISGYFSCWLVAAGVACGAALRHACWEQCKRDLGQ